MINFYNEFIAIGMLDGGKLRIKYERREPNHNWYSWGVDVDIGELNEILSEARLCVVSADRMGGKAEDVDYVGVVRAAVDGGKSLTSASKDHVCSRCAGVIKKGDKYLYLERPFYDGPKPLKICTKCEGFVLGA